MALSDLTLGNNERAEVQAIRILTGRITVRCTYSLLIT